MPKCGKFNVALLVKKIGGIYPVPVGIIKYIPICLDMLEKNCFVKIFSNFSEQISMEMKILIKRSFLLKYSIDLEKIYRNRVTILLKGTFFAEIYFSQKFFV